MHRSSTGELGTLNIDGRQVGGFSSWAIETMVQPTRKGNLRSGKLAAWKATALKYWMYEKVDTGTMDAIFYCFNGVAFSQVSTNRVKVVLPAEYPLGQPIRGPLEMTYG